MRHDWTGSGWRSIEPDTETLYISVQNDRYEHLGGFRKVRVCSHAFVNREDAENYLSLENSELVEIKVRKQ